MHCPFFQAGFDSLSDWYNDGLNTYEQAGKVSGYHSSRGLHVEKFPCEISYGSTNSHLQMCEQQHNTATVSCS